jgi:DNA-binding MarR family transcriptional regulator
MVATRKSWVDTRAVTAGAPGQDQAVFEQEADVVMAACRVLVAVSAQSIAAVEDVADLTQFRVLVIVASRTALSLSELADAAHIHLSKASRLCDRMVSQRLLNRADDPADRRQLTLTLTPAGQRLVRTVMNRRRAAILPVLARMSKQHRQELVSALGEFAAASGELAEPDLWAMGWTS